MLSSYRKLCATDERACQICESDRSGLRRARARSQAMLEVMLSLFPEYRIGSEVIRFRFETGWRIAGAGCNLLPNV